ncbi:MAG TPA: hypothetical protein VFE47_20540 [Tepidisphaeraceae bacterium]|jgi:hypothetical protein|nr:hypothetical protein [Tepidisphaeraceae bacterium]
MEEFAHHLRRLLALLPAISLSALVGCRPVAVTAPVLPTPPAVVTVDFDNVNWSVQKSLSRARMLQGDGTIGEIFAAVWDTRSDPTLVVLRNNMATLSGQAFTVDMVDRTGKIVRTGRVDCDASLFPYCLVEIRTDSDVLPAAYRNHWTLGVAFSLPGFRDTRGARFIADSEHDDGKFNDVFVEPIKWGKDYNDFSYGYGNLMEAEHVDFRPAETAIKDWTVGKQGAPEIPTQPTHP